MSATTDSFQQIWHLPYRLKVFGNTFCFVDRWSAIGSLLECSWSIFRLAMWTKVESRAVGISRLMRSGLGRLLGWEERVLGRWHIGLYLLTTSLDNFRLLNIVEHPLKSTLEIICVLFFLSGLIPHLSVSVKGKAVLESPRRARQ